MFQKFRETIRSWLIYLVVSARDLFQSIFTPGTKMPAQIPENPVVVWVPPREIVDPVYSTKDVILTRSSSDDPFKCQPTTDSPTKSITEFCTPNGTLEEIKASSRKLDTHSSIVTVESCSMSNPDSGVDSGNNSGPPVTSGKQSLLDSYLNGLVNNPDNQEKSHRSSEETNFSGYHSSDESSCCEPEFEFYPPDISKSQQVFLSKQNQIGNLASFNGLNTPLVAVVNVNASINKRPQDLMVF